MEGVGGKVVVQEVRLSGRRELRRTADMPQAAHGGSCRSAGALGLGGVRGSGQEAG